MAESAVLQPMGLSSGERKLRWFIIGWITLSTILNLVDKNTLSILAPTLEKNFDMSERAYARIVMAYQIPYAIMYMVGGRFVDRVGGMVGMTVCILWWSIATMLQALARGVLSLGVFRFLLGVGEPGNYPAALRITTTWFSKEERGLPISIWSSGSSIGSLVAVPMVAFIARYFGWQAAFVVPGFLGLIWVLVWVLVYKPPANSAECKVLSAERAPSAQHPVPGTGFLDLLRDGRVRAIILARFLTDPVWVFYLAWTPKYLAKVWHFDLVHMGLFGWIPFLFGSLGGVFGGVASDWMIRRGCAPAQARKRLLYLTGLLAPLGMLTGFVGSAAMSLALIALMAFVCYVWFIDTAALMSDVFPDRMVGSVLGLAAGAGQFAGILMAQLAGTLLEKYSSYTPLFFIAASGHLLASLILFLFLKDTRVRR